MMMYKLDSARQLVGESAKTLISLATPTPKTPRKIVSVKLSPDSLDGLPTTPHLDDLIGDDDKWHSLQQRIRSNSGCFTPMALGEKLDELMLSP
jgi:hypothetical protein